MENFATIEWSCQVQASTTTCGTTVVRVPWADAVFLAVLLLVGIGGIVVALKIWK